MKPLFLKFLLTFSLLALSNQPALGVSRQDAAQQHPLETRTEMVKLDVTVLNNQGGFVDGLEQKNFRVLDNGVEQPIVFFAPVTAPAKVVVLLETSPAVYLLMDEHRVAAYWLSQGLANDDEVALVTYADVPKEVVSFTTNKAQLVDALNSVQYMIGMTSLNLYDSVSAVIDGVSAFPGKKALVLLTTGLDSSPPERFDAITQKLRRSDAVIFAIGLGGSLKDGETKKGKSSKKNSPSRTPGDPAADSGNGSTLEKARRALITLSAISGGRAYFPDSGDDFASAYRQIAEAVRHEYVLGITPQHDGKQHTLTVDVLNGSGHAQKKKHGQAEYTVSAREGYIAPAP